MILLIDNYDSFSYNLYQLIGSIDPDIRVIRNDEGDIDGIRKLAPKAIIISPGPGRPENAGLCTAAVAGLRYEIPILGVCLGHQAICQAYGAEITYAKQLMHGRQSGISHADDPIFAGCPEVMQVARYHSLAADGDTLPAELAVIAETEDREVMAVRDRKYPVYGFQFHPESIMTPEGSIMMKNFLDIAGNQKR